MMMMWTKGELLLEIILFGRTFYHPVDRICFVRGEREEDFHECGIC
jgi:hypothetical protein